MFRVYAPGLNNRSPLRRAADRGDEVFSASVVRFRVPRRPVMPAVVDREKCTGCESCVEACPLEAIEMQDEIAVIDEEVCGDCGACVDVCPTEAITLERAFFQGRHGPALPVPGPTTAISDQRDAPAVWSHAAEVTDRVAPGMDARDPVPPDRRMHACTHARLWSVISTRAQGHNMPGGRGQETRRQRGDRATTRSWPQSGGPR